jgi:hypothetical protein
MGDFQVAFLSHQECLGDFSAAKGAGILISRRLPIKALPQPRFDERLAGLLLVRLEPVQRLLRQRRHVDLRLFFSARLQNTPSARAPNKA